MNYRESSNFPTTTPMTSLTRRNMLGVMGGALAGIPMLAAVAQGQTSPAKAATESGKGNPGSQALVVLTGARDRGLRTETTPKWVRVFFGGEVVASSRRVLMLFDGRSPVYYFPEQDVRMDFLTPTAHRTQSQSMGEASWYTLKAGGKVAENAAWHYPKPLSTAPDLRGYVAFDWRTMDAWFEEGEEVFGHAHDPAHRIDVLQSSRHVRVVIGGTTVAETRRPVLLFETGVQTRYYLPKEDVRQELLRPSDRKTICAYKGEASYYSVAVGGRLFNDVIWYYRHQVPEVGKIANRLAFYSENADVTLFVDDREVPKSQRT